MKKIKTQNKTETNSTKLLVILLSVFLGPLIGLITYFGLKHKLTEVDAKDCKIILWIVFILQLLFAVSIVTFSCLGMLAWTTATV
ncbi:MAG: hypothetical protein LBV53_03030 [Mycoplasmataceae bacterium]|nr:hypothetical protein [Mycoplasmataceae bacterium]